MIVGKLTVQAAEKQGFAKQAEYTRDIDTIIIHITATAPGTTIEQIRQMHLDRGFSNVGYHWLVDVDGTVYKGRDEDVIGAHCAGYNQRTIGIAYMSRGSDTQPNARYGLYMTENQRKALEQKVVDIMKRYNLEMDDIRGHNDYNLGKACPCFKVRRATDFFKNLASILAE